MKILALLALLLPLTVLADGGKENNPWQKVEVDQCAEWSKDGGCEQDPSDQSGSTYICEVLVVCPEGVTPDE